MIKLIIIGAGMFYYYRLMDENNGYYISIPIIGAFIVLLGFSLTLDAVAGGIFLTMLSIFLYFVFTFMAQIDTIVSISFITIILIADIGNRLGYYSSIVPIIVLILCCAILWLFGYIDVYFVIAVLKSIFFYIVLGVIWTMAREKFLLYLLTNFGDLPIL
jgi:membrane protein glpM